MKSIHWTLEFRKLSVTLTAGSLTKMVKIETRIHWTEKEVWSEEGGPVKHPPPWELDRMRRIGAQVTTDIGLGGF